MNRSLASWLLFAAVFCGLAGLARPVAGATSFENEAVRVEFLEVGEVSAPGVDVPLRFRVENRGTVAIGGTLDIGGPTRGILPRNEPSHPFQVEPGATSEIELKVSFAEDCVDGFYPVHAFVLLQQGRGDRAILTRLVRPAFAAGKAKGVDRGETAKLATYRPAPVENVVDRYLEEKRLSVMADYARSLEGAAGRAYRLGPGEGAYRVLLVPGRQGMLDGYLYFSGPKADLYFRGLRVVMQGPEGVDVSGGIQVEDYREEKRENGFAATHQLRLGEWESLLTVEVAIAGGEVRIRCASPDPVVEVSLGEASLVPVGLTAGVGYHFANPENVTFTGDSPVLNVRFAQFEFGGGVRVTMGSEEPLRAIRVLREESHASAAVAGRQWLRVIPEEGELPLVAKTTPPASPSPGGQSRPLPVIWFRRDFQDLSSLVREVKEWARYETGPVGLILDGWQAGGAQPVPPDAWPPPDDLGGVEGLARLAETCREAGVTLVLADSYGEIASAARGFQFDVVEFDPQGRPAESLPDSGTYALRPDAVLAYFEENWKQIQFHFKPGAAYVGGVDAAGHEFRDREGHLFPPGWVRERWLSNAAGIRKVVGDATVLLAEGGGDWLAGQVDAIVMPRKAGFIRRATRVPWWGLLPGGGTPLIETFAEDEEDSLPRLSERVADGRLLLFGNSTWMHEALQRAWLTGPVLERLRGRRIAGMRRGGESGQWILDWGDGLRLWSNGGDQAWPLDGAVVPPGGFWVEGPELRGGVALVDGMRRECLESSVERFAGPAAAPVRRFPVSLRVDSLTQQGDDRIELALRWRRPELIPPGSFLRFFLFRPGVREEGKSWSKDGLEVEDGAPAKVALPAQEVSPESEWEVAAALENAGGRRLSWGEAAPVGLAGDGLIWLGRVRRLQGEIPRWEASWRTEEEGALPASSVQVPPARADFGWTQTQGAFRLKKSGDQWRLFPLPGQNAFELTLQGAQIPGFLPEVKSVKGGLRRGGDAKPVPHRWENGSLTFQVEPDVLVYDLAQQEPAPEPVPAAPEGMSGGGKPAAGVETKEVTAPKQDGGPGERSKAGKGP